MGLKVIITSHSTCLNCSAGMNSRWHPEISEKLPCYLPCGKADGAASPALSRVETTSFRAFGDEGGNGVKLDP